jgi:hypothetical protein
MPFLDEDEKLNVLIKKACNIARNNELRKSIDKQIQVSKPRSLNPRSSRNSASLQSSSPRSAKLAIGKVNMFIIKLIDEDRDYLRRNKGCFNCRKINVDHIFINCPELPESNVKAKKVKKESISTLEAIVESTSDFEYLCSAPIIKVATIIKETPMSSFLIDCGAAINVMSSDKVKEHAISTQSTSPVRVQEPLNPHSTIVNQKVVSKVCISKKG